MESAPVTLTPAEATAKLAEISVALAPPPPPDKPANAVEASARLDVLKADKTWRENYLAGRVEERREFDALTQLVASGNQADFAMAGIKPEGHIDGGPGAALRDQIAQVPIMRAAGISEGAIRQLLEDRKVSQQEYDAVKQLQTARHGDPDWVRKLLSGDHAAKRESLLMSIVLSSEIDETSK